MNKKETREILLLLYSDIGKEIPPGKVEIWAELCKKVPFELGRAAALRMVRKTKTYGEPAFRDYREHVNNLWRQSKAALRLNKQAYDPAQLSRMTAEERQTLLDRQRQALEVTKEQAVKFLGEINRKRLAA